MNHEKRHPGRDDLTGEHIWGDAGQLVLFVLFMVLWVADMFFLKSSEAIRNAMPVAITLPLAVLILIASAYMARTGLKKVFGEVQESPGVIRSGVFNIVRHPIYLSALLLYCGMLLLAFSQWAALVWLVAIPFYHYLALFEEKMLLKRFGESYRAYMRDVPRWIPKLKRK